MFPHTNMTLPVETRHGKMILPYTNDLISQKLRSSGEYEWYVVETIHRLSRGHDNGIILDVGANFGTISLPLARDFPGYEIHAFEIQPTLIQIIKENIKINELTNIILHEHGLGDISDIITIRQPLYESATNLGAFSLNPLVWKHSAVSVGQGDMISVTISPLDNIKFDLPIRCIKLDVEGYESKILEGAVDTLRHHDYPPIVYEMWTYNSWWRKEAKKLTDLLKSLGYSLQRIDDTGIATHP